MLNGMTAVVTGSTSGIGLGIAEAMAKAGCNVVLNSFTDHVDDHALAKRLSAAHGVEARYVRADMSKPGDCARLVQAAAALGPVQILVNNAGIQHVARVEDFPVEKWDAILAINLSSAFHTTRAAVPGMREARWGRILNIASAHGLTASPFKSAYVAAKHGLVGLTKTVALEVAEEGITCNAICPGYVRTPLVEGQIADQMKTHGLSRDQVVRDVMLQRQPTKQFVSVEDIGAMAVFLCSDAAAQITGAALSVDGGWTAL
jgi:3-hydroxybutyrate dehydrogenase